MMVEMKVEDIEAVEGTANGQRVTVAVPWVAAKIRG